MRGKHGKNMLIWLISAVLLVQGLFLVFSVPAAEAAVTTSNAASRSAVADRIIATGMKYIGRPYYFGARSGDTRKFDCSSFTQYVYGINGIKLPRTSRQQAQVGKYVPKSQVEKADLVFFSTKRNGRIDHVAIYMGNNKLLHAITRPGVTVSKVNSYWMNTYVGARRVI